MICIPLFFIVLLTVPTFFLGLGELNSRLSRTLTLFLSTFALLFTISHDLPKLAFSTVIDELILVTTLRESIKIYAT
jgi:hypothetical protein